MNRFLQPLLAALLAAPAFAETPHPNLKFDLKPAEMEEVCAKGVAKAGESLDKLAAMPAANRTFANTVLAFDLIGSDLETEVTSPTFLKYVSTDKEVREAGHACETKVEKFAVDIYAREDLYKALKAYEAKGEKLPEEDQRLLDEILVDFKRNGLDLPPVERSRYNLLKKQLVEMEGEFSKNLNEVKDFEAFTADELAGLPDDFLKRLEKTGEGKFKVTLDYPDYYPFMRNAKNASARKRLNTLMSNKAVPANAALLEEILALRLRLANMLGYKTHADFVLEDRMAENPKAVWKFLKKMRARLVKKGKLEKARLLALKKQDEPAAKEVYSWDYSYYDNQLKKKEYDVDDEKVKEYFPMAKVVDGMLALYQELLDVEFKEVTPAEAWHEDVKRFEVKDKRSGQLYGHFYMDLFPRDGKYKHAAAFTLVGGRAQEGGYRSPVASIVANFNKPSEDRPSLLKHGEVETFFHEFGHIMHQVLTRAKHPRFAGTRVARDFVEAPSQIFENWVWEKDILKRISSHYQTGQPLPDDLLTRMVAAKNMGSGLSYLRQAFYAWVDQELHDAKPGDPAETYRKLYGKVGLIPMMDGVNPAAGFGHLMGYSAGYYGYMWSEVFASDMYAVFQAGNILSPEIGRRYRQIILEPGDSRDAGKLVREFLGREPDEKAFLKSIGLQP